MKTTVNELASSLGNVIPNAKNLGVSFEEINTGMVMLTKQGINTSESATALKSMFRELGDSGSEVGKIIKNETGKSFQELIESGMNVQDVLKIVSDYAKNNGTSFNELFGRAEALKGALGLLNTEAGDYTKILGEMNGATGDVDKAFNIVAETSAYKMKSAFNNMKNSFIEVGGALTPFVEKFADGLSKVAEKISNLSDKQVQSIAKFALWGTAISGALKIVGGGITTVSKIADTASKISNTISKFIDPLKNVNDNLATTPTIAQGANNAIRDVGTTASATTSFLSPMALGIGAAATAIGLLGVAWYNNEKKCKEGAEQLREAGNVAEDLTGKVKGTTDWVDKLFGHEYNIKFSDEYKTTTAQIEENVRGWAERLKELQKNIDDTLNNTEIDDNTKREQIKSLVSGYVDTINTGMEEVNTNRGKMDSAMVEYAKKTFGEGTTSYTQFLQGYSGAMDNYKTIYDANTKELLSIYEKLGTGEIEMTDETKNRILALEEEKAEAEKVLRMSGTDDYLNWLELKGEKERNSIEGTITNIEQSVARKVSALNLETEAQRQSALDQADALYKAGAISKEQYDNMITDINNTMDAELELNKVKANSVATRAIYDEEYAQKHGLFAQQIIGEVAGITAVYDEQGNQLSTVFATTETALDNYAQRHGYTSKIITNESGAMTKVLVDDNGKIVAQLASNEWAWENNAQAVVNALQTEINSVNNGELSTSQAMEKIKAKLAEGEISAEDFGFSSEEAFLKCAEQALLTGGDVDTLKKSCDKLPDKVNINVTDNGTASGVQRQINGIKGKSVTIETIFSQPKFPDYGIKPPFKGFREQGTHGTLGGDELVHINESVRKSRGWELVDGPHEYLGRDHLGDIVNLKAGASVKSNTTSTAMMKQAVKEEVARAMSLVQGTYFDYTLPSSNLSRLAYNTSLPNTTINNNNNYDDTDLKDMLKMLLGALIDKDSSVNVNLNAKSIAKATAPYMDKELDIRRRRK